MNRFRKFTVRPDIVADGDDAVDHNPRLDMFLGDVPEELRKRVWAVGNQRFVLNIRGA